MHIPGLPDPAFDSRRLARPLLAIVAILSLGGCASLPLGPLASWSPVVADDPQASDPSETSGFFFARTERPELGDVSRMTPRGPGHVFATPEEAAIDALAYCYLLSRGEYPDQRRMRGGAVQPSGSGFSYAEPAAERSSSGDKLRYRLRPTDVAHFQHHPDGRVQYGPGRSPEREARRLVTRRDPAGRPLYRLTPKRFVQVFTRDAERQQTLARLERSPRRATGPLALRLALDVEGDTLVSPIAYERTPDRFEPRR